MTSRAHTRRSRPAIRTKGLTKRFGRIEAVANLDLEVHRGEVFGYLGPNGAGKTTTIRLLLDFIRPTEGSARVLGGSGADPDVRRRIGYLPGELRFDARHTARDVIELYGALRGKLDRRYVGELLERFELDPSRRFAELSSGNRRKVALVQAFMNRPTLLLLDEPTQGLDPLLQEQFHELVREVVARGTTVFLSSHVLHEVEELADRVGILRSGRFVAVARVSDLRRRARQRLELHVRGRPDAAAFRKLPEVVEARTDHSVVRLVVEGSVERVLKVAASMHVHRLVTTETDLEDVFLALYRGEDA